MPEQDGEVLAEATARLPHATPTRSWPLAQLMYAIIRQLSGAPELSGRLTVRVTRDRFTVWRNRSKRGPALDYERSKMWVHPARNHRVLDIQFPDDGAIRFFKFKNAYDADTVRHALPPSTR